MLDHKSWTYGNIKEGPDTATRRWMEEIWEHNISIKHIEGDKNIVADMLSRAEYYGQKR